MKHRHALLILFFVCLPATVAIAQEPASGKPPSFDPELARRLGADERGMKTYVLCILKTGPNDAKVVGKDREDVFAGHFANIGRLAKEGKLVVAGPFGKNERSWRGLYIFNVPTVEEAEKLVILDPAVKAGVFAYELTPWYGSAAMMIVPETHKRIEKPAN
ncbi:MAG: YciI family protein [Thermoanaerobaculia bacterium]